MQNTSISGIFNFSAGTASSEIISLMKKIFPQSCVLYFYYKSNNSTDNNLLEVFPLGLQNTKSGLQLMAIKQIDGKYEMRRYNTSNIQGLYVGDVASSVSGWENLPNEKDTFFVGSLDETTNVNLEVVYRWEDWVPKVNDANTVTNSENENDDFVAIDDFYVDEAKNTPKKFFFLPSNPQVLFLGLGNNYMKMGKRTVTKDEIKGYLTTVYGVLKELTPKCEYQVKDFHVGDVVKFNVPSESNWSKLKVTITEIEKDVITCVGVDKDSDMYIVKVFAVHIKPANDIKTKVNIVYQPAPKVDNSSGWD